MDALGARGEVLERERRWSLPVALLTLAGIGFFVASIVIVNSIEGDGDAEFLQAVHEQSSDLLLSGVFQALGFILFVAPLVYLFRAAAARSDRLRVQLIGLIVAAPLFLATASMLEAVGTNQAADDFVAGKSTGDLSAKEATAECRSDLKDDASAFREDFGAKGKAPLHSCVTRKVADDKAASARSDAPTRTFVAGFALAGAPAFAFALFYTCLWAMRTGLLTRFWGSLGMALGATTVLLGIPFTLAWFLYFALLAAGWVPNGRPPAWERGEAVPWPTPGDRAAADLEGGSADPDDPPRS